MVDVTPIPKVKKRGQRGGKNRIPPAVRSAVQRRSLGRCELRLRGCMGNALHMHHRKRRSQGGQNTPGNLLHLCPHCHGWVHNNVEYAKQRGWLA